MYISGAALSNHKAKNLSYTKKWTIFELPIFYKGILKLCMVLYFYKSLICTALAKYASTYVIHSDTFDFH